MIPALPKIDLTTVSKDFRQAFENNLAKIGVDVSEVDRIEVLRARSASFKVTLKDGDIRWL